MKHLLSTLAAIGMVTSTQAAFINVDDTDPNNVTIAAGDFEQGFSVDGNLLTTGLGNSGSVTLPDGGHTISGSWIDLGQSGQTLNLFFARLSDPTAVTSGIIVETTTDGFFGTVGGASSVGGFTGTPYFTTADPTFDQNGGAQVGLLPFLSVSFTPEPAPEVGSTFGLLGLSLAGLRMLRRKS